MRLVTNLLNQQKCWRVLRHIDQAHFLVEDLFITRPALYPLGDAKHPEVLLYGRYVQ